MIHHKSVYESTMRHPIRVNCLKLVPKALILTKTTTKYVLKFFVVTSHYKKCKNFNIVGHHKWK